MKVAATKIAEKMSKAAAARIVSAAKARHEFVGRREELMKPVNAFGDRIRFLPSIPATEAHPIHNIGYNIALVEIVQEQGFCANVCGRAFSSGGAYQVTGPWSTAWI